MAHLDGDAVPRVVARSGIAPLDDHLPSSGFPGGTLTMVMAPPGTGKTLFCLGNVARQALEAGHGVLYVAPSDAGGDRLFRRLVAGVSRVPGRELERGDLSTQQRGDVTVAVERISQWPFYEERLKSMPEIEARARSLHSSVGLGLIVVDYIQRIRNGLKDSWADLALTSAGLQDLAIELGIPVLAASQPDLMARRAGTKLSAANMKGSGAMEEDADLVLSLLRAQTRDPITGAFAGGLAIVKGRDVDPICWPAEAVDGVPACGWSWNGRSMRLEAGV